MTIKYNNLLISSIYIIKLKTLFFEDINDNINPITIFLMNIGRVQFKVS